jgi:hypothetical protein
MISGLRAARNRAGRTLFSAAFEVVLGFAVPVTQESKSKAAVKSVRHTRALESSATVKKINFAALTLVVGRGYPNLNGSCLHFGASILGWFHLQT